VALLPVPGPAGALDFGLVLTQELKTANEGGEGAFSYTPAAGPWVSGPLGEKFNLYLSGKIRFAYTHGVGGVSAWREPVALPELDRSELTWQVSPVLSCTVGRQGFRDPAGLTAGGLFDGVSAGLSAGGSRFTAGAYYTGLLGRDTAAIVMTGRDREGYAAPVALDGTYFASRRVLGGVGWEHPGLGSRSSLALGLLGQFDLNGGEDRLHSQYISGRYGVRLPVSTGVEAAWVLGIREASGGGAGGCCAGSRGGSWGLPGAWEDRVSFRGLYTSPGEGAVLWAFMPVTSLPQGQVFTPAAVGLSVVTGAYRLQPRRTVSLNAEYSYFIRTDTVSFRDGRDVLEGTGYFLGGEVYAAARWFPLPDLALSAGGGAFFPRPGNAFTAAAAVRWKAVLGVVLSL
jgi:hypothetical protein